MNLVYTALFLVCVAQARVPLCHNCAPPFSASEPAADSQARFFDSPKPADGIEPAADSHAPAFESPEPAADSLAPADDTEPVLDSQAPANLPAFHSSEPADDSLAPEDDLPDLAPVPSPGFSGRELPRTAGVFDVTNYGAVADGKTESSLV